MVSWAIVGMHPPINPIRSRWIRPAPGPLWTHLLEVPLLDQKELDLGHDKTDLKSSGSAIILFYLAVCQPDHIYTRYVPCISFERSCIFNIWRVALYLSYLLDVLCKLYFSWCFTTTCRTMTGCTVMSQSHHTECRLNLPTQVGNFQQVTHSSQHPLSILYALHIISIICYCSLSCPL